MCIFLTVSGGRVVLMYTLLHWRYCTSEPRCYEAAPFLKLFCPNNPIVINKSRAYVTLSKITELSVKFIAV
jgi:hypothetical protein